MSSMDSFMDWECYYANNNAYLKFQNEGYSHSVVNQLNTEPHVYLQPLHQDPWQHRLDFSPQENMYRGWTDRHQYHYNFHDRDGRPHRRRRSHLDDIYLPNYDDDDDADDICRIECENHERYNGRNNPHRWPRNYPYPRHEHNRRNYHNRIAASKRSLIYPNQLENKENTSSSKEANENGAKEQNSDIKEEDSDSKFDKKGNLQDSINSSDIKSHADSENEILNKQSESESPKIEDNDHHIDESSIISHSKDCSKNFTGCHDVDNESKVDDKSVHSEKEERGKTPEENINESVRTTLNKIVSACSETTNIKPVGKISLIKLQGTKANNETDEKVKLCHLQINNTQEITLAANSDESVNTYCDFTETTTEDIHSSLPSTSMDSNLAEDKFKNTLEEMSKLTDISDSTGDSQIKTEKENVEEENSDLGQMLPAEFPVWESSSNPYTDKFQNPWGSYSEIDSDEETVCFDDFISIDKINTMSSYLPDRYAEEVEEQEKREEDIGDDHRVIDMVLSTPSPRKRPETDTEINNPPKKRKINIYEDINSDRLLNEINQFLEEDKQNSEDSTKKGIKRYRSKSLELESSEKFNNLKPSKSLNSIDNSQNVNFDLQTNLLFLLDNHNNIDQQNCGNNLPQEKLKTGQKIDKSETENMICDEEKIEDMNKGENKIENKKASCSEKKIDEVNRRDGKIMEENCNEEKIETVSSSKNKIEKVSSIKKKIQEVNSNVKKLDKMNCKERKIMEKSANENKIEELSSSEKKIEQFNYDGKKIEDVSCHGKKIEKMSFSDRKIMDENYNENEIEASKDEKRIEEECSEDKKIVEVSCNEKKIEKIFCNGKKGEEQSCDKMKIDKANLSEQKIDEIICNEYKKQKDSHNRKVSISDKSHITNGNLKQLKVSLTNSNCESRKDKEKTHMSPNKTKHKKDKKSNYELAIQSVSRSRFLKAEDYKRSLSAFELFTSVKKSQPVSKTISKIKARRSTYSNGNDLHMKELQYKLFGSDSDSDFEDKEALNKRNVGKVGSIKYDSKRSKCEKEHEKQTTPQKLFSDSRQKKSSIDAKVEVHCIQDRKQSRSTSPNSKNHTTPQKTSRYEKTSIKNVKSVKRRSSNEERLKCHEEDNNNKKTIKTGKNNTNVEDNDQNQKSKIRVENLHKKLKLKLNYTANEIKIERKNVNDNCLNNEKVNNHSGENNNELVTDKETCTGKIKVEQTAPINISNDNRRSLLESQKQNNSIIDLTKKIEKVIKTPIIQDEQTAPINISDDNSNSLLESQKQNTSIIDLTKKIEKVTKSSIIQDEQTAPINISNDNSRSLLESQKQNNSIIEDLTKKIEKLTKTPIIAFDAELCLKCIQLPIDRFPPLQKIERVSIVENDCYDKAVVLDAPEIKNKSIVNKTLLEKSRKNIVNNHVESADDIIEIKPDIPIIDLTDGEEKVNNVVVNDTIKNEIVKTEEKLDLDIEVTKNSNEETITLYRSDETISESLDVQATVVSLSPLILNKNKTSFIGKDSPKPITVNLTEESVSSESVGKTAIAVNLPEESVSSESIGKTASVVTEASTQQMTNTTSNTAVQEISPPAAPNITMFTHPLEQISKNIEKLRQDKYENVCALLVEKAVNEAIKERERRSSNLNNTNENNNLQASNVTQAAISSNVLCNTNISLPNSTTIAQHSNVLSNRSIIETPNITTIINDQSPIVNNPREVSNTIQNPVVGANTHGVITAIANNQRQIEAILSQARRRSVDNEQIFPVGGTNSANNEPNFGSNLYNGPISSLQDINEYEINLISEILKKYIVYYDGLRKACRAYKNEVKNMGKLLPTILKSEEQRFDKFNSQYFHKIYADLSHRLLKLNINSTCNDFIKVEKIIENIFTSLKPCLPGLSISWTYLMLEVLLLPQKEIYLASSAFLRNFYQYIIHVTNNLHGRANKRPNQLVHNTNTCTIFTQDQRNLFLKQVEQYKQICVIQTKLIAFQEEQRTLHIQQQLAQRDSGRRKSQDGTFRSNCSTSLPQMQTTQNVHIPQTSPRRQSPTSQPLTQVQFPTAQNKTVVTNIQGSSGKNSNISNKSDGSFLRQQRPIVNKNTSAATEKIHSRFAEGKVQPLLEYWRRAENDYFTVENPNNIIDLTDDMEQPGNISLVSKHANDDVSYESETLKRLLTSNPCLPNISSYIRNHSSMIASNSLPGNVNKNALNDSINTSSAEPNNNFAIRLPLTKPREDIPSNIVTNVTAPSSSSSSSTDVVHKSSVTQTKLREVTPAVTLFNIKTPNSSSTIEVHKSPVPKTMSQGVIPANTIPNIKTPNSSYSSATEVVQKTPVIQTKSRGVTPSNTLSNVKTSNSPCSSATEVVHKTSAMKTKSRKVTPSKTLSNAKTPNSSCSSATEVVHKTPVKQTKSRKVTSSNTLSKVKTPNSSCSSATEVVHKTPLMETKPREVPPSNTLSNVKTPNSSCSSATEVVHRTPVMQTKSREITPSNTLYYVKTSNSSSSITEVAHELSVSLTPRQVTRHSNSISSVKTPSSPISSMAEVVYKSPLHSIQSVYSSPNYSNTAHTYSVPLIGEGVAQISVPNIVDIHPVPSFVYTPILSDSTDKSFDTNTPSISLNICPSTSSETRVTQTASPSEMETASCQTKPNENTNKDNDDNVDVKMEYKSLLNPNEIITIDLTWMDSIDTEQLQNEIELVAAENNEPEEHVENVNVLQEPLVAPSPADSGISSPPWQTEYNEQVFSDRLCICGKPAEYVCGCVMAMYCSVTCQFGDWLAHKEVCMKHNGKAKDGNQN